MTIRYLFDTGPEGTTLTTANTGASLVSIGSGASATFAASKAVHGGFGAKFVANAVASLVRLSTEASSNQQTLSFCWKTPTVAMPAGGKTTFFNARSGSSIVGYRLQMIDHVVSLLDAGGTTTFAKSGGSNVALADDTQYRFEQIITLGSTTAGALSLNIYDTAGTKVASLATSTANFNSGPMDSFDIGITGAGVAASVEIGFDDVQNVTGGTTEIGAYVPGANAAPTVTAAASPAALTPNATVTLTGTATDSDGTIASRLWDFTSIPAGATTPTIANSATNSATFTPTVAGIYVARFTATDNLGASSSASVSIPVGGTTATVIAVTANAGAWTSTPSSSTITSVLADTDAATYAESPASPATAATLRVRLAPLQPLSTFSLVLGSASVNGTGNLALTATLFEGSTARKTWTGLTPTGADITLTMTAAECATVTNWSALDVELSAIAA